MNSEAYKTGRVAIYAVTLLLLSLIGSCTYYNTTTELAYIQGGYTHVVTPMPTTTWIKP